MAMTRIDFNSAMTCDSTAARAESFQPRVIRLRATRWGVVIALIFAGMIAAGQVGKAAVALPLIQRELGLGLFAASWVIAMYGILGAVAGLPAGAVVSVLTNRAALAGGLVLIGVGSLAGAAAPSGAFLIATRALESFGFLAVVVAIPALLRAAAAEKDNDLVFSFWGTYMPGGSAAMMLVGAHLDWQALWIVNGALALAYAPVILWLAPQAAPPVRTRGHMQGNVKAVLTSPGPLLIASAFGVYAFQYFAIIGLFPTLLVERLGLSTAAAGTISAVAVVCNGIGNLLAGALMRLRVPLWMVVAGGFVFTAAACFGVFAEGLTVTVVAAVTCLILAVNGLTPASLFAAAPRVTANAHLLTVALGLIVQASNIGQLLGVPAMAAWVERFGWGYAWVVVVATSVVGIAIAARLRVVLRKRR
jgi:predicted MFS family arabinose efflux permease